VAEPKSAQHARLGRALRAIRTEQGLTIEETAGRAGLNPRYLAGVERGEINIAVANLLKTLAALDSSLLTLAQRAAL
jgi:transcriptional regulator with XRE-family HTH domain